jgi:hypothetical protein
VPRCVDRRHDRRGWLLDLRRDGIIEPDVPQRDRIVGFERDGETGFFVCASSTGAYAFMSAMISG